MKGKTPNLKKHEIVWVKHSKKAPPAQAFLLERIPGKDDAEGRVKIMWESTREVTWYSEDHMVLDAGIGRRSRHAASISDNKKHSRPPQKSLGEKRRRNNSKLVGSKRMQFYGEEDKKLSLSKTPKKEDEIDDTDEVSLLSFDDSAESISQVTPNHDGEETSERESAAKNEKAVNMKQQRHDHPASNSNKVRSPTGETKNGEHASEEKDGTQLTDADLFSHVDKFFENNPVMERQLQSAMVAVEFVVRGIMAKYPSESPEKLRLNVLRHKFIYGNIA